MRKDSGNFIYIGSGKYRGRKIALPDIETTRPSKSIVRDSIFDTLQSEVYGVTFIEMFAGSGSIGFEAISRGAEKLYLLERNRVAFETLKKNSKIFDENIETIFGDSFQTVKQVIKDSSNSILYIDPPFNIRDGMESIYEDLYKIVENIDIDSSVEKIIFEHISSEKPKESIGEFELYKSKKFGKTSLSYFRKEEN